MISDHREDAWGWGKKIKGSKFLSNLNNMLIECQMYI